MKHFIVFILSALLFSPLTAQVDNFNLDSVGNLDYDAGVNDVWGFVDSDGTEYAILGTVEGTAIISLEDPTDPEEVYFVQGANSTWRDMKTYDGYAYITTDVGADGLLIIDLNDAENGNFSHSFYTPDLEINSSIETLWTCHNLYIDESGYCYLTGCNLNNGGTLILDLNSDRMMPELVGYTPPVYAHDCYASNDRLYTADIYEGNFSVYDVSDKSEPELLARQNTTSRFTHNLWASDDGNYLFTTDERPNAFVDAYDISDLDNIRRLDVFRPKSTEGLGVIPHNTHYFDGYLVTSWYTDGVKVVDVHQPDNMVEVASYDTYEGPSGGFNGCWGAYPFLPSGLILASDRSSGLFVLEPNYTRAAYVEGLVIDSETGDQIEEASISLSGPNPKVIYTNSNGSFKTGIADEGVINIEVDHPFYAKKTVEVEFMSQETQNITVELDPLYESYQLSGMVLGRESGMALAGSVLEMKGNITSYEFASDNGGQFSQNVFQDTYDLYTGHWGYETTLQTVEILQNESLNIELKKGYKDGFVLDLGWTVEEGAVSGNWERAKPTPLIYNNILTVPVSDLNDDLGTLCYVTGAGGDSPGVNDVDNGTTRLISPLIELGSTDRPELIYAYWFSDVGGFGSIDPDDTLKVSWMNEMGETIPLRSYSDTSEAWRYDTIDLKQELPVLTDGQVIFSVSDLPSSGHIVEAAIDGFQVRDADTATAIQSPGLNANNLMVYPNPTEQILRLGAEDLAIDPGSAYYQIIDLEGRILKDSKWIGNPLDVGMLEPGMYYIVLRLADGRIYSNRFIIH